MVVDNILSLLTNTTIYSVAFLFMLLGAKATENLLGTAKTILIQKNKELLAALMNTFATYIVYLLTDIFVNSDSALAIHALAWGAGLGTYFAMKINNKMSKDRVYINVILSSDKEELKALRDYLVEYGILSVVTDGYTKDWEKTLSLTVYAETKAESKILDDYLEKSSMKFKRLIANA